MKTDVSSELLTHLAGEVTTLAYCWTITRTDGEIYRFTDHDCDLTVATHEYLASSGMGSTELKQARSFSVDNMEAMTFLDDERITDTDLRGGLFDDASVDLFLVNWADATMGVLYILKGWGIGNIEIRDAGCTVELRGLGQKLCCNICDLYAETCRAALGDDQCGVDLTIDGRTQTGASAGVEAATNRQRFFIWPGLDMSSGKLNEGFLTWASGSANAGLSMTIAATDETSGTITLLFPMPNVIGYADEFEVVIGCDKSIAMCVASFDNGFNFRGEPWVPVSGTPRKWDTRSVRRQS